MANFSSTYPSVSPTWQCNFAANGGRIDPRATFSRSDTPPTYAAPSAVHYWSNEKHLSSENLITYSSDISQSAWVKNGVTETGGQAAPDGGTDAYKLTEDSANSQHRIYFVATVDSSASLTVSCYAKYIGRQWVSIRLRDSSGTYRHVWFDIQNGTKGTEETSMTGSIAASGNGYYKLTATVSSVYTTSEDVVIAGASADNVTTDYTGLNGDAFAIWGINMSNTGQTTLNETSGQIHREYAPTLKSVSYAGQPRFEYSASDGESMGVLIEGQAQNLLTYSSDLSNAAFTPNNVSVTTEAIAPDGTLSAVSVREDGSTDQHRINQAWAHAGGYFTISVYAKAIGSNRRLLIREGFVTGSYASFDLNTGTVTSQGDGGTGSIESVGNGWYRCSMASYIAGAYTMLAMFYLLPSTGTTSSDATYTGDYYSGLMLAMAQAENQVWASSWISTSGSTVTRASDQLSVATADIGYTGGPVSVVAEFEAKASILQYVGVLSNTGSGGLYTNYGNLYQDAGNVVRIHVTGNGGAADTIGAAAVASSGGGRKIAARYDNDNFGLCVDSGTVVTDTSGTLPVFNKLDVGSYADGGSVNSTIKRIAVYNEALSDTNLQAITS